MHVRSNRVGVRRRMGREDDGRDLTVPHWPEEDVGVKLRTAPRRIATDGHRPKPQVVQRGGHLPSPLPPSPSPRAPRHGTLLNRRRRRTRWMTKSSVHTSPTPKVHCSKAGRATRGSPANDPSRRECAFTSAEPSPARVLRRSLLRTADVLPQRAQEAHVEAGAIGGGNDVGEEDLVRGHKAPAGLNVGIPSGDARGHARSAPAPQAAARPPICAPLAHRTVCAVLAALPVRRSSRLDMRARLSSAIGIGPGRDPELAPRSVATSRGSALWRGGGGGSVRPPGLPVPCQ